MDEKSSDGESNVGWKLNVFTVDEDPEAARILNSTTHRRNIECSITYSPINSSALKAIALSTYHLFIYPVHVPSNKAYMCKKLRDVAEEGYV